MPVPHLFQTTLKHAILFAVALGSAASYAREIKTDGTRADVQAKVDLAVDGDIIQLPPGTFSWDRGVVVKGKGIWLRGTNSPRIVARSVGAVTLGIGVKTFRVNPDAPQLANGTLVRAHVNGGDRNYNGFATGNKPSMEGRVVSHVPGSLTVDVRSFNHSGTYSLWIIEQVAVDGAGALNETVIVHNGGASALITVAEDDNQPSRVSFLKLMRGSGSGPSLRIERNSIENAAPVLVSDCWFDVQGACIALETSSNQGVVWNSSFVCLAAGDASSEGINLRNILLSSSWTSPSTMGEADVNGRSNFYIEDCDFHGLVTSFDADENSRVVVRKSLFNQASAGGSHGADTSTYGVRHLEVYDCTFVFNDVGAETMNISKWLLLRGGTGVIADCVMPDILSQAWSDKSEIILACWNLRRNGGPNPLWGAGIDGIQYPAPRQIGLGVLTAPVLSGRDGKGRQSDGFSYVGDPEPLYIFNNTGPYRISIQDYSPNEGSNSDTATDYIKEGRDFYTLPPDMISTPKWRWVKPSSSHPAGYPHHLRRVPQFVQIHILAS